MEENSSFNRFRLIISWLLSVGFVLLLVWLAVGYWSLSGKVHIIFHPGETMPARIERFAPNEADKIVGQSAGGSYRLITKEPVSFDVKTSRSFAKATVNVTYQNGDNQSELKLGVVQKNGVTLAKTAAIKEPKLDQLPRYWTTVREGDLVLFQKDVALQKSAVQLAQKIDDISYLKEQIANLTSAMVNLAPTSSTYQEAQHQIDVSNTQISALRQQQSDLEMEVTSAAPKSVYRSISDFLAQLPEYHRVATLNYDIGKYLRIKDYQPMSGQRTIDRALRGSHTIFTYIKNEPLNFTFTIQELNQVAGADDVVIEVWQADTKVSTTKLSDDGNISANQQVSAPRTVAVNLLNLPEGMYQLRVNIKNDESLIRQIVTSQHLLTFTGRVWPVDNQSYHTLIPDIVERPLTLFGGNSSFTFTAPDMSGQQAVDVAGEQIAVSKVKTNYSSKPVFQNLAPRPITVPAGNIQIINHPGVAFTADQYFDPKLGVASLTDLSVIDDRDFVMANYPQPSNVDGWLVASQTFEAPFVYTNDQDRIRFTIGLPGFNSSYRTLKVKQIEVTLERDPVTLAKVWQKVTHLIKR